jgi:AAA domain
MNSVEPSDGGSKESVSTSDDQPRVGHRSRKFRLLSDTDVEHRPSPPWLIDQLLPTDALAVVYGRPEHCKSFLVLDWAFSVATGTPWHDHAVKRGAVIYVAAEGASGLGVRVRAWKQVHGVTGAAGVSFLDEPVHLVSRATRSWHGDSAFDDVVTFINAVKPLKPALVVIDTLARSLFGANEDSAQDMGQFVDAADAIRKGLNGATVLIVHHTTKTGDAERGSSALRGAVATVIRVERAGIGPNVTLFCNKQKDARRFDPIHVTLTEVTLPDGSTSCVLEPVTGGATQSATSADSDTINDKGLALLKALAQLGPGDVKTGTWRKKAGLAEKTFHRRVNKLVAARFVEKPSDALYRITPQGLAAVPVTVTPVKNTVSDSDRKSTQNTVTVTVNSSPLIGGNDRMTGGVEKGRQKLGADLSHLNLRDPDPIDRESYEEDVEEKVA